MTQQLTQPPSISTPGILNMSDRGDRSKFNEALRRRWPVPPALKTQYFDQLEVLLAAELTKTAPDPDVLVATMKPLMYEPTRASKALALLHEREQRDLPTTLSLDYAVIRDRIRPKTTKASRK